MTLCADATESWLRLDQPRRPSLSPFALFANGGIARGHRQRPERKGQRSSPSEMRNAPRNGRTLGTRQRKELLRRWRLSKYRSSLFPKKEGLAGDAVHIEHVSA